MDFSTGTACRHHVVFCIRPVCLGETGAENEEGLIDRSLPLNKTGVAPARDMLIVVLESEVME